MKEREKLFTAVLLLIVTLIFTGFVSYTNNIFGIRTLIEEKSSDKIYYSEQNETIPDDVFVTAEEIKELYVSGAYDRIYSLGNEDFQKKGEQYEFIEYCKKIKQMCPETQKYVLMECSKGREINEYKVVYTAEKSSLIIYLQETANLLKISGFEAALLS